MKTITVDCREPKEYRDMFSGAKVEKMIVGDYTNGKILIERKEAKDFAASIFDQRLWRQLDSLNQSRAVIIIEGNLDDAIKFHAKRSKRPYQNVWNIVYGAYSSLVARENYSNVKIAHVANKTEFKYVVRKIFEKCDYKERVVNRTKSPNVALNIMVGFPGVSVTRAVQLLKVYKTPKNALSHIHEWKSIVGNAVERRCVDALNALYRQH